MKQETLHFGLVAALLAGLGSLALLLGAWGFQHLGGLSPCPMCLWQRWPHAVAALIGIAAFFGAPLRVSAAIGAATMALSTGLGVFHSGVERGWWEGPTSCTSGDISGLSPEQLMEQIMSAPLVRCDEIVWSLFGLTMANWNALFSLGLFGLWLLVLVRRTA